MSWCDRGDEASAVSEAAMLEPIETARRHVFIDIGCPDEELTNPKEDHLINTVMFFPPPPGCRAECVPSQPATVREKCFLRRACQRRKDRRAERKAAAAEDSYNQDGNDEYEVGEGEGEGYRCVQHGEFSRDELDTEHDTRPVLILAHGYGSGLAFWSQNVDDLARRYRVIAFDWLGFGRSSRPKFHSVEDPARTEAWFVDTLARLVDALTERGEIYDPGAAAAGSDGRLPRFLLAGHSMGGFLSFAFAMRYPERIHSLVLVSPVGVNIEDAEEAEARRKSLPGPVRAWLWFSRTFSLTPQSYVRAAGPMGPRLLRNARRPMAERFRGFYVDHEKVVGDYSYHITARPQSAERAFFDLLTETINAHHPIEARFGELQVRSVLWMYGDPNDWMDVQAGIRTSDANQDNVRSTVRLVADSGHNLFMDNPGGFASAWVSGFKEIDGHLGGSTAGSEFQG